MQCTDFEYASKDNGKQFEQSAVCKLKEEKKEGVLELPGTNRRTKEQHAIVIRIVPNI